MFLHHPAKLHHLFTRVGFLLFFTSLFYFYKGGWENDETVGEAAVREAIEEAGVKGDLKVLNFMDSVDLSYLLFIISLIRFCVKINFMILRVTLRLCDLLDFFSVCIGKILESGVRQGHS